MSAGLCARRLFFLIYPDESMTNRTVFVGECFQFSGALNGLGGGWGLQDAQAHRTGWGLQNAAGVPPRVSPILRLRPGAGAVGRGAAANEIPSSLSM